MAASPPPFSGYEFLIAWRYLRARRAEGGVSVMTWISFLGIALAVAALIATLAVRTGFRYEFVGTILGANPHVSVYDVAEVEADGRVDRTLEDYAEVAAGVAALPGVAHAAAVIRGQVMATHQGRNAGVEVVGISPGDLSAIPLVAEPEVAIGDIGRFSEGIAIGSGVARELGVNVGDSLRLISPDGARTPFGTSPRVSAYEVVYIFQVGRWDIDRIRVYMPFAEAQTYFNRDGVADEIEVMLDDPESARSMVLPILEAAGGDVSIWTWEDSSGAFLQALQMEDNIMFIILSILVLIATMNIVSGLIMLVKNKSRDIGILRTMGLSEGSVLRVFFLCGSAIGVAGTIAGVALGCAFAIWIDPIFDFVNWIAGGGVWDPSVRFLSSLPARLEWGDVLSAVTLSLGLSFLVTIFPARRAARMNPVEALRYE
ncbi:lipoprotein-releasing ABC transporter permease subunit [Roseibacterium sp. SDUM158016]|uniref:lipoprotein-releasing ABC transporter permease subunit n=1 Tax=Roseicyclus sediminis TaxID=2980997 RepID=UPI0021D2EC30|nr:lipoprotein-releasing ABC transporter permease subunit [Roseibacterium sp. SDUM158016]MCU4653640.1 lipoprotein-releasing ABC transporter permease subunit [Roseibacterium sp. SDUM158016]